MIHKSQRPFRTLHIQFRKIPASILFCLQKPREKKKSTTTNLPRSSPKSENYLHTHTISLPEGKPRVAAHEDANDDVNNISVDCRKPVALASWQWLPAKEKKNSFATKWLGKWKMFPYLRRCCYWLGCTWRPRRIDGGFGGKRIPLPSRADRRRTVACWLRTQ